MEKQDNLWSEIIKNTNNKSESGSSNEARSDIMDLNDLLAGYLYKALLCVKDEFVSPIGFEKKFSQLLENERSVWIEVVSMIPRKLASLHLSVRQFDSFCHTCIISDEEIQTLAQSDHEWYWINHGNIRSVYSGTPGNEVEADPFLTSYSGLPEKCKNFFLQLNYAVPSVLKKAGFEIFRQEEAELIDDRMILDIARAIHSRYLGEVRKQESMKTGKGAVGREDSGKMNQTSGLPEFDSLPGDIMFSNLDNAYHIPTKLLAIGYKIKTVAKGFKPLVLHIDELEVETMARVEHLRWCWDKRLNGWIYGQERNESKKTHPGLIPYDSLSESEKEKDRELVRMIPALLKDMNYEVSSLNPRRFSRLSYSIKPHSSIHRILNETRQLNDQLRKMVSLSPVMEEMISIRNSKIEEAIAEVEGSYNYAKHIQKAFLPDDLYIRACIPKNFVLYLPKDIVSGDFYFFSRHEQQVIFAAADCTGHGIPGALLSTIGYGLLDQAVNELKLTDPEMILRHLYTKLHGFLNREKIRSGISDDLDIALCSLDTKTGVLTFSGVNNPLYLVTKGELTEFKAKNFGKPVYGSEEEALLSEKIELMPGDTLYLCTDGYSDQFGGKNHKKYRREKLRCFLLSIQDYSMPEQGDLLFEEIERWREDRDEEQTDDILVIGIRI